MPAYVVEQLVKTQLVATRALLAPLRYKPPPPVVELQLVNWALVNKSEADEVLTLVVVEQSDVVDVLQVAEGIAR